MTRLAFAPVIPVEILAAMAAVAALITLYALYMRARGALAWLLFVIPVLAITLSISLLLRTLAFGWVIEALLSTTLLAQESLRSHVKAAR